MDAIAFFKSAAIRLPKSREEGDFATYLKAIFDEYLALFATLNSPDHLTQEIRAHQAMAQKLCDAILGAVKAYESGLPHGAYVILRNELENIQCHLGTLSSYQKMTGTDDLSEMYRIRVEVLGADFTRPDLHHVPFEMRHKVRRARYSLPGLPCLYLGSSLYIAWEELGRPAFDSVYFARFKAADSNKLEYLDLGHRPDEIAQLVRDHAVDLSEASSQSEFFTAYAICWPLIAASSIKRLHKDDPFIAEYVIPQLVLQWIIDSKLYAGIRYFSVRVAPQRVDPLLSNNYVFPSLQIATHGHCQVLRQQFQMSDPLFWPFVQQTATPWTHAPSKSLYTNARIALVNGYPMQYYLTSFGNAQRHGLAYYCDTF